MKLRISVRKNAFKVVHEDEFFTTIEIESSDRFKMGVGFPDNDDVFETPVHLPDSSEEFSLSAADLKSSIVGYLNSVPSQADIAAAMCEAKDNGEVTCANPGKGMFTRIEQSEYSSGESIMSNIRRMLSPFYKSSSDFIGVKSFNVLMSSKLYKDFHFELASLEADNKITVARHPQDEYLAVAFTAYDEKTAYRNSNMFVSPDDSKGNYITVEEILK